VRVATADLAARLAAEPNPVLVVAPVGTKVDAPHELLPMPRHAAAYAQLLYATLRKADAHGAALIAIVPPEETGGLWDAAHDRIRRATARRPSAG
jgi:hypothetical protein